MKRPLDHPSNVMPNKVGGQNKLNEKIYDEILKNIIEPITGKDATFGSELHKIAKKFLGDKFLGVFSVDKLPKKIPDGSYAIINLDESNLPGSHWIGIVGNEKKILVYDSFGRDPKKILPTINENTISTEQDAEQEIEEKNCGPRTISALIMHKYYGKDAFMDL